MKKRIVLSSDEENEDEKRDSEEEWEGDDEEVVASADSAIPAHCKGTDFYIISQQIADDECLEYCVSFAAKNGGPRIELWHSEAYVREHWLPLLKAWNKQQSANDSGRRGRSQRSAASKAKQILKQSNDDEEEEEDEEEDLDNDIKKKSTVKLKKTKKSKNHNDDDDDFGQSDEDGSEYSEEENDKKKRSASKHNNNDDDDEIVVSKSKKRKSIVIIDDDNNENDVKKTNRKKSETPSQSSSKSFQSRSSSGRSQLLNSKQEQKRLDAMEELRLIKLKGLSALSSSDDSEYEYSNDESESRVETSPRVSKPKPRATLSPYKDDFFDKKTPKSSTKRVTPKGLGLPRPLSPQPVYEEEDESDIDNFILNSDEEREEEEQRLAALEAKREKEKRKKKKMKLEKEKAKKSLQSQHADSDEEEDDDVGLKSRTKSAKKRRRSIIVDDEEEEEEEEDEEDEEEDEEDEEDEDEDDDDDDDDLEDGPLTYLQVDLMRDERRESMEFTLRKSYTKQEAMKIYIEMLARTHIDPDFIASLVRDPQSPSSVKYSTASRQLENVICTSRESLLGSGAWNKEFVSELQARPFYMMNKINPEQAQCERCLACNRKNDHLNCKAYLCGSRYDAKRAWTGSRWDREIPSHVFIETDRTTNLQVSNTQNNRLSQQTSSSGVIELSDDEEDDDEEEGKDEEKVVDKEAEGDANKLKYWFHKYKWPHDLLKEKETKWELGSRCFSRSQLYHNLMHYKFHLLLKVKKKLLRYDKNVDAMCNDIAFISQETDRYNKLLEETQKGYGGNEHRGYKDLWNDDDDDHHPVLEAIDSSRPSNVMTQSSGGNSLLRWLGRNSNSNNQRDEIVDD
jgi:hypothetical protein